MEYILNKTHPEKYLIFYQNSMRFVISNLGKISSRKSSAPQASDHLIRLSPEKMEQALSAFRDYIEENLEEFRLDVVN